MDPSFSTASDGVPAVAAPMSTPFGGGESSLHALGGAKRRRIAFDFSIFQQQHEEGAWILSILSCDNADAATAATPQGAAGGHHMTGEVVVTTTTHGISSDDWPLSAWVQKQQREKQHDQKMLHVRPCLRAPRPCLVVGPGQFGGKVGLLGALQPPELTKYLTVSE